MKRISKLKREVKSESEFIEKAMRFWRWYAQTPEMKFWTKETLRAFYRAK